MTHEERRQKTIKISAKPFDKGATDEDGGTLNICNSSCLPLSYNVLFLHSSNNLTMKHIVLFVNCYTDMSKKICSSARRSRRGNIFAETKTLDALMLLPFSVGCNMATWCLTRVIIFRATIWK